MQAVIEAVYPPQCITCTALVTTDFGLCGDCWRDTPFISGLVCHLCGTPLPGDGDDATATCDDCLRIARPWQGARAAMLYRDNARRMVLALKHGDRMDLARPAGQWLARAARPLIRTDTLIVPIPLHWWRFLRRTYNQSVLLSLSLSRVTGLPHCPDALLRPRNTGSQEGRDRDARFANMAGAFRVHPRHRPRVEGKDVLLVDDVMTSGATFAAATEALVAAGAKSVCAVALARVAKDA